MTKVGPSNETHPAMAIQPTRRMRPTRRDMLQHVTDARQRAPQGALDTSPQWTKTARLTALVDRENCPASDAAPLGGDRNLASCGTRGYVRGYLRVGIDRDGS